MKKILFLLLLAAAGCAAQRKTTTRSVLTTQSHQSGSQRAELRLDTLALVEQTDSTACVMLTVDSAGRRTILLKSRVLRRHTAAKASVQSRSTRDTTAIVRAQTTAATEKTTRRVGWLWLLPAATLILWFLWRRGR